MRMRKPIVLGLLAMHALLVGWIAVVKSPALDEMPHLAAGISHWEFGDFSLYRVNPPLVRMIAALPPLALGIETDWNQGWSVGPFARSEFSLGRRLVDVNGRASFRLFTYARWACLPLTLLGGYLCYRWACDLYGMASGIFALLIWCFSPNVLGWGATICPDLPAATFGLLAAYSFWNWLRTPGAGAALWAGLSLGLALLTKSTWILLLGLWPVLWMFWRVTAASGSAPGQSDTSSPRPSWRGLAGLLLLGLYLLNSGYGFSGSFTPLGELTFISRTLTGHEQLGETGNRFRGTVWEAVPVPLPKDYVLGIDIQKYDFEKGKWSYLRGEQKFGGWWWYYLYALAVKTPVGGLGLLLLSFSWPPVWRGFGSRYRDELILLAPALSVLVLVSSQTGFNRYVRYVLPAVPFLFVWISRVGLALSASDRKTTVHSRLMRGMVFGCLLAHVWSSLMVWPHSMSYFNELTGGPERGHEHLLDANIDWGQDLLELRRWADAHPEADPLHLSYFGWVLPSTAGLTVKEVPRFRTDPEADQDQSQSLEQIEPGWYVVSINHLMGYRHYESDRPWYTWLQEFEPVGRVGYSLWVFHLQPDEAAAFRDRHRSKSAPR